MKPAYVNALILIYNYLKFLIMKNKNYPVSQAVLYIVCQNIIDNLRANLAAFTEFSASYDSAFVDGLQKALDDAKALPTESIRALQHESLRLEMVEMLKPTLKKWKALKRYIAKAFTDAFHEANWNAAGWANYQPAADKSWPSVNALMSAGMQYISDNKTVLLANDNMPATFEDAFRVSANDFANKNKAFIAAKQLAQQGTDAKITLNADLYSAIIKVCLDGQLIFEDEYLEKEFSFAAVAELVTPAGAAEAAIEVKNKNTEMPLAGVEVVVVGTDKQTVTNNEGDAELTELSEGPAKLKFMCDGFADLFVDFDFTAGVRSRVKVEMVPLVVEVPVPEAVTPTPVPVTA